MSAAMPGGDDAVRGGPVDVARGDEPAAVVARGERVAARARRRILRWAHQGPVHLGASLSIVDIVTACQLRLRGRPGAVDRDRLVLSKGHGVWALYAVLAELGERSLSTADHHQLAGHPSEGTPGVEASTGALGHGLAIGAGMAEAARLQGWPSRVSVVLGDGELDEGSVWESVMYAAHRSLSCLVAVVDRNGMQQEASTEEVLALEPLAAKWQAFGWRVLHCDGHDMRELQETLAAAERRDGGWDGPTVVIARTRKGFGVPFMESDPAWHHASLSDELLDEALRAVDGR